MKLLPQKNFPGKSIKALNIPIQFLILVFLTFLIFEYVYHSNI